MLLYQPEILAVMQCPEAINYVDDETLREFCFDRDFWNSLTELAEILTPLTEKLSLLEGDVYVTPEF
ncbi:MAG: hypothetical protein ACXV2C_07195 [Candidatus Bathyarchaeia archaeon]